jgi:hypothetical protein
MYFLQKFISNQARYGRKVWKIINVEFQNEDAFLWNKDLRIIWGVSQCKSRIACRWEFLSIVCKYSFLWSVRESAKILQFSEDSRQEEFQGSWKLTWEFQMFGECGLCDWNSLSALFFQVWCFLISDFVRSRDLEDHAVAGILAAVMVSIVLLFHQIMRHKVGIRIALNTFFEHLADVAFNGGCCRHVVRRLMRNNNDQSNSKWTIKCHSDWTWIVNLQELDSTSSLMISGDGCWCPLCNCAKLQGAVHCDRFRGCH